MIPRAGNLLLALNLAGAILALVVNVWAARRGDRDIAGRYWLIAGLAACYCVTTIALMITGDGGWSLAIARGLGPIVYVAVWSLPAIGGVRRWHQIRTGVVTAVEDARAVIEDE